MADYSSGCAGFMIASFLGFGATGEFKITYLATGPTEMRLWFIALNTALIVFGTAWIERLLPWILVAAILFLVFVCFRTQKYLWQLDMSIKAQTAQSVQNEQAEGEKPKLSG